MDRLDHQVSYWNGVGSTKEFGHPLNINRLRGEISPDGRMLDFGCGYGPVSAALFDAGYRNVVVVDPSPMMVAKARESYPSLTFLQVDPARLPFADGAFDTVLLFTVFTCVPTDDGQLGLVAEARRVLRDNGLLYVSDLWLQRDARNVARYERFRTKYSRYGVFELPEGVVLRHHDRAWIVRLTAAFELLALDEIVVRTMNGHPAEAFQWFGRKKPTDGLTTAYRRTGGTAVVRCSGAPAQVGGSFAPRR